MTTTVINGDVKGLLESRPLTNISYNFARLHYVVLSFVVEDWEAETQSSLNLSCLDFAAQPRIPPPALQQQPQEPDSIHNATQGHTAVRGWCQAPCTSPLTQVGQVLPPPHSLPCAYGNIQCTGHAVPPQALFQQVASAQAPVVNTPSISVNSMLRESLSIVDVRRAGGADQMG